MSQRPCKLPIRELAVSTYNIPRIGGKSREKITKNIEIVVFITKNIEIVVFAHKNPQKTLSSQEDFKSGHLASRTPGKL
jgi:hypothetical protein